MREHAPRAVITGLVLIAAGCTADTPLNPSFPLLTNKARAELQRMREDPAPARRPILIVGGMLDAGIVAADLRERVESVLVPGASVVTVNLFGTSTMEAARDRLIAAVDAAWPSDDPVWTTEVDVVGFSLGGLVARDAACGVGGGAGGGSGGGSDRRLRIARLFTIASPHSGARAAWGPAIDGRVVDLRPGSAYLGRVNGADAEPAYECLAYVRLGDAIVGPEHAGLNGQPAYWVEALPLSFAHTGAYRDPRILADISRHLRGEEGYTTRPPAPLPDRPHSTANSPEPVLTAP